MTENETASYPVGQLATFADHGAVSEGGEPVLVTGPINGEAWEHEGTVFVPVFVARDGREPSTIMVDARNILTVERTR